jgi:hypothetical protein
MADAMQPLQPQPHYLLPSFYFNNLNFPKNRLSISSAYARRLKMKKILAKVRCGLSHSSKLQAQELTQAPPRPSSPNPQAQALTETTSRLFSYQPLDSPRREFRLLRLLPSQNFSTQIQCELFHAPLYGSPAYEALSYVWGDPGVTVPFFSMGLSDKSQPIWS